MARSLEILEYPDERLTRACEPVDLAHLAAMQPFIDDLIYTMFLSGGVGLAAPQVGHLIRVFVVDRRPINGNELDDPWVFVNPTVEVLDGDLVRRREGCLSFPGVFVHARRPRWVRVTAFDRHGEEFTMDTTGSDLLSLCVQHENDHLDGSLMSEHADKKGVRSIAKWAQDRG
jgi:peptide deformylase